MNRSPRVLFGIFAWLSLELAAFIVIVQTIGLLGALLLGLATSFAGAALLRRTGDGALEHLRSAFAGAPQRPGVMLDGLIRAFAAVLLILPGFISDLVGLALAAPSTRQMLARWMGIDSGAFSSRQRGSNIVDLAPEDWASLDQRPEPARR
jgi:UPF0716 protein FxsA